jgi:hypothetical protein
LQSGSGSGSPLVPHHEAETAKIANIEAHFRTGRPLASGGRIEQTEHDIHRKRGPMKRGPMQ